MDPWAAEDAWGEADLPTHEDVKHKTSTWPTTIHYDVTMGTASSGNNIAAGPPSWFTTTSAEPEPSAHWTQVNPVGAVESLNSETIWSKPNLNEPAIHEQVSWHESSAPDDIQMNINSPESDSSPGNQVPRTFPLTEIDATEGVYLDLDGKSPDSPPTHNILESSLQSPGLEDASSPVPEIDAFGTFETGLEQVSPTFSVSIAENNNNFPHVTEEMENWPGAWGDAESSFQSHSKNEDVGDEWETAKRQKAVVDKVLVRLYLARIISFTVT
jgi:hypothetical protein